MDNNEILNGMGFELITGNLWRHQNNLGVIEISNEDDLQKICIEVFKLGQKFKESQIKTVLGI